MSNLFFTKAPWGRWRSLFSFYRGRNWGSNPDMFDFNMLKHSMLLLLVLFIHSFWPSLPHEGLLIWPLLDHTILFPSSTSCSSTWSPISHWSLLHHHQGDKKNQRSTFSFISYVLLPLAQTAPASLLPPEPSRWEAGISLFSCIALSLRDPV